MLFKGHKIKRKREQWTYILYIHAVWRVKIMWASRPNFWTFRLVSTPRGDESFTLGWFCMSSVCLFVLLQASVGSGPSRNMIQAMTSADGDGYHHDVCWLLSDSITSHQAGVRMQKPPQSKWLLHLVWHFWATYLPMCSIHPLTAHHAAVTTLYCPFWTIIWLDCGLYSCAFKITPKNDLRPC